DRQGGLDPQGGLLAACRRQGGRILRVLRHRSGPCRGGVKAGRFTSMNIFVAGATGVIGKPLLKLLRDAGHTVTGTTRSAEKIASIEALGARGGVVDAFDAAALRRAMIAAKPEVVIHQLTDLPDVSDPSQMAAVREKNSRLRIEGTRNLMAAAKAAGVRRVVAQSIAFIYAPGNKPYREGDPLDSSEAQRLTMSG